MRKSTHGPERDRREALSATTVRSVMRPEVVCVTDDTHEDALMALLLTHNLHGVPVVDEDGLLVGFVSMTDIVRERYENADTGTTGPLRVATRSGVTYRLGGGFHEEVVPPRVSDFMSNVAVEISERASLATAATLMAARQVNQMPVVSESGQVVGMLHAYDVLRWLHDHGGVPVKTRWGRKDVH